MSDDRSRDADDDPFETLFAGVERRRQPSEAARERAFAAVSAEWEALQARRRRRRRLVPMAAAATLLVGIVGLVMLRPSPAPPLVVELAQGHVQVDDDSYRAAGGPLSITVPAAATIRALGPSRWIMPAGSDVRVDAGTRFAWRSPTTLRLDDGRVFVATERAASVAVETDQGVVTDIGTRFLVARHEGRLEVAVREGLVELVTPTETWRSDPVTPGFAQLLVEEDGRVARGTEPASHERWNWIHTAPKGYTARNPVALLHEIGRDLGKEIRFAGNTEMRLQAEEVDGDFRGLAPWQALRQVANALGVGWRDRDGVITIFVDE